jgi:ABC-2 type transport system ATP-binding protein/lipopolysaccharide transport system ATP-binding protein
VRVIEIDDVWKEYRLGERGSTTLRDAFARLRRREHPQHPHVWALRDVSLTIDQGEVVGFIGRNGAGKSTMLKLLARITEPTRGRTRSRGRVGALLDVGTGFHGELTGRENIYVNGALLGLSRREIERRFDDIVAFAELERFLDTPLKRYSSGMQLRLAFAIAAEIQPEIVVVDEVLAVGDLEFQRRCLGRMHDMQRSGRTVLFVSHDMSAVAQLCTRVVWLDRGQIVVDGAPPEVIAAYVEAGQEDHGLRVELPRRPELGAFPTAVTISSPDDQLPVRGEPLVCDITLEADTAAPADLDVSLIITSGVTRILDEAWSDSQRAPLMPADIRKRRLRVEIPPGLAAGTYGLSLWLGTRFRTLLEDEITTFTVERRPGDSDESSHRMRVLQPTVSWTPLT